MPAYNESDGLTDFLCDIDHHVSRLAESLVYVVVDDASSPSLESVVRFAAQSLKGRVDFLRNERNRGHGPTALTAYRRGLSHNPDLVVHVDGDGQISGADVAHLVLAMEGANVAHGVRRHRTDPWFRRMLTAALGLVVNGAPPGPLDVNTPFRAYRPGPLVRLLSLTPAESLVPHVHFTLLERRLGWLSTPVEVEHRARRGEVTIGTTWRGVASRVNLPSLRLLRFCWRAASEVRAQAPTRAGLSADPALPVVEIGHAIVRHG
jgi:undecaprenyl-phosphate 4-deoxy-4-formamido-L-arabinose transferase